MLSDMELDVRSFSCPMPLLKAKQALNKMSVGSVLKVVATDPGTKRDFVAFVDLSPHELLKAEEIDGCFFYWIVKG